jgi:hypothetical protein
MKENFFFFFSLQGVFKLTAIGRPQNTHNKERLKKKKHAASGK